MYIGLKNIQHLLSDYPSKLRNSDELHCLTGWTKLAHAPHPYTHHLLYVCTDQLPIESIDFSGDMHILYLVSENADFEKTSALFPESVSLLTVRCGEPESIFRILQDYYNVQCGISMFGQTLLEFLAFDNGLQDAIEYSFQVFRNPIFVFDTNYNLIAATWNAVKKLGIHDQVVIDRRFSNDDFKMASRQNNIHAKVLKSEIPIRAYNEQLGYEQMYCSINTKKNRGHICVSAINKPFDPIDKELMLILKKYIDQQMEKDAFIHTSRGFNYEYFLRDLLDKKFVASQASQKQLKYVEKEFSGNMYCMLVETARSASTVNGGHIRNVIEMRFPGTKSIIYNGQIIAILSLPDKHLMPKEYWEEARSLCEDAGLFAGMSNCFQNILELEEYYNQALRAIELGTGHTNEPGLFRYEDYSLEHVKNIFLQRESPETFCHPKMKFLLDYDKQHHSELAYTLYMYLTHERNLAAAAEAMQMHRTSLVYRFKKIYSLLNDDFDDYKERMYLILSYEMHRE